MGGSRGGANAKTYRDDRSVGERIMKVFMHIPTGAIVIAYQVYGRVQLPNTTTTGNHGYEITAHAYDYIGDAVENEHSVTCIFGPNWNAEFEEIGTF